MWTDQVFKPPRPSELPSGAVRTNSTGDRNAVSHSPQAGDEDELLRGFIAAELSQRAISLHPSRRRQVQANIMVLHVYFSF